MLMASCFWCKKVLATNELTCCSIDDDDDGAKQHQLCSLCHLTGHACQSSCPCCWFEFGEIFVKKNHLCSGCFQSIETRSKIDSNFHQLCEKCSQCLLCSFRNEMTFDLFSLSYRDLKPRIQNILYTMQRCVQQIEIEREPCSICMERLYGEKVNPVRTLSSCQHRFHENCIEKWFKQKRCCPCCRHNYQNDFEPSNDDRFDFIFE